MMQMEVKNKEIELVLEHTDGKKSWDFNDANGGKKQRNRARIFMM